MAFFLSSDPRQLFFVAMETEKHIFHIVKRMNFELVF